MNDAQEQRLLLIATMVAFGFRLLFLTRPIPDLLGTSMPDDAFYYFQIARNVSRGLGSTFDGIDPTNGYHPLWMLICSLMFRFAGHQSSTSIYAALTVAAAFDAANAYVLYRCVRMMCSNRAAATGAMFAYALGLHQILLSINGLETSLAVLVFLLTGYLCLRALQAPDEGWRIVWIGLCWGLLCLSRTDVAVFALTAVAAAGWRVGKTAGAHYVLYAVAISIGLVTPWLAWNYSTFGALDQVSGKAYIFWNREIYALSHGVDHNWTITLSRAPEFIRGVIAHLLRYSPFGKSTALLLPAAFLAMVLHRRSKVTVDAGGTGFWVLFVVLPQAALVLIHGVYRWMICPHYYAPLAAAILVFVVCELCCVHRWMPGLLLVLALVNAGIQFNYVRPFSHGGGYFPWQREFALHGRHRIDSGFPTGTVIGSTDCGIHGFYSPHVVVNLDCVVNNACFTSIRSGRLYQYLQSRGIDVLLLNKYHENYFLKRLLPPDAVARKPLPKCSSGFYYELESGVP